MNKYEVTIKKAIGTCESTLFQKMAGRGDIQAKKISELLNKIVTIKGYAQCNIKTDDKDFDVVYYDTKEFGFISSGSNIFAESVNDYFEEVKEFRIVEVKTNKGKTYKAVPVLEESEKKEETTASDDDLPF